MATFPPKIAMARTSVKSVSGSDARRKRGIRPRLNLRSSNDNGKSDITESHVSANLVMNAALNQLEKEDKK